MLFLNYILGSCYRLKYCYVILFRDLAFIVMASDATSTLRSEAFAFSRFFSCSAKVSAREINLKSTFLQKFFQIVFFGKFFTLQKTYMH